MKQHPHLFKLLGLNSVMKNWKINHKGKNAERNRKDRTKHRAELSQVSDSMGVVL